MHRIFVSLFFLLSVSLSHTMHIGVPNTDVGIGGLFRYAPHTGKILAELAETLLHNESPLTRGERELIASYVSYLNECQFCCNSHSAIASCLLDHNNTLVEMVKKDPKTAPISDKLKLLLQIAATVQKNGKNITQELISHAYTSGITERELHDTVLIAAAFCMFNRYVDGLAAWTPTDPLVYQEIGEAIAQHGYIKALRMLLCK
jgi:uncharacterized peroxidase-related enzyme